jgi:mono/diheme cytochrome c family protein
MRSIHTFLGIVVVFVALTISSHAAESVRFDKEIWPILVSRCIECHGEHKQEGDLRLDSPEHIQKGGQFGEAIAPGTPVDSAIFELVSLPADDKEAMPGRGEQLSEIQIQTIEKWISEGAHFDGWQPAMQTAANALVASEDVATIPQPASLPSTPLTFNRDIRTILTNNCSSCHGPDAAAREADLRLDGVEFATQDLGGRQAITPGSLKDSEMIRRLFHDDPEQRMPPVDANRQPSDEERLMLAAWVAQGAEYEAHWAYVPPVQNQAFSDDKNIHPIDQLIRSELGSTGLKPSTEADPRTLARRLSFDLVGLPPTEEQVNRLVNDGSPESYSALVDELLESAHYGERMAIHWLDQVRYADTNGYHSDESRNVTAYRDYVIDAFNDNKPYDAFTIEQLAGDLLPNATLEQKIAAGFNRMNQLSAEGGAQSKEYRAKYAADRVRALGSVWMGATLGCAECHDHKFDPFTTKDFYKFAAFFADLEEHGVYSTGETWDPIMNLPTPGEQSEVDRIDAEIHALEQQIAAADISESFVKWIQLSKLTPNTGWHPVRASFVKSKNGTEFEYLDDFSILATGPSPALDDYAVTIGLEDRPVTGFRLEIMGHPTLRAGFSRANAAPADIAEVEIQYTDVDGTLIKLPIAKTESDRNFFGSTAEVTSDGKLHSRWLIKAQKPVNDRVTVIYTLEQPIPKEAVGNAVITVYQRPLNKRTALGRFRISFTSDPKPQMDAEKLGIPMLFKEASVDDLETGNFAIDRKKAEQFYRATAPRFAKIHNQIDQLHIQRHKIVKNMDNTMISNSVQPRMTRILPRGNWMDESGEIVDPGVPDFLHALNVADRRATRLDLANWLVDEDNPLTARVFMNRLWKLYFGRGISSRLDDFGGQGEWPTHPELLDSLALEFQKSGWNVKQMVKLIVTSDTYRQSSQSTDTLRATDPENRLYARQSRLRLEAEMIRDNALAISGLLSAKIGGDTIKPYQPEGYWRNAQTFGGESLAYYPSKGDDQYRRGVYTYWKRSFLHPSLLAFDAPTREECTAERIVSNTPIQALVQLNDPTYVESARAFAEKIIREGGADPHNRIQFAFNRALSRNATPDEVQILRDLSELHQGTYAVDTEAAKKLLSIGQAPSSPDIDRAELAAWTSVARTILNLPEVITRF